MRPTVWYQTAEMIADHYRAGAEIRDREAEWWAAEGRPFSEVLDRAGRARMANGQRHPHQRRLTRQAVEGCVAALTDIAADLERTVRFHDAFVLVQAAFRPVRGAGELAVYDATDRICKRLGHVSEHVIYLHAGARVGARRLLGGRLPNGDAWGIMYHQVPDGFRGFSTHEIEDILCLYKDDFSLTPEALRAKWDGSSPSRCRATGEHRPSC